MCGGARRRESKVGEALRVSVGMSVRVSVRVRVWVSVSVWGARRCESKVGEALRTCAVFNQLIGRLERKGATMASPAVTVCLTVQRRYTLPADVSMLPGEVERVVNSRGQRHCRTATNYTL